MPDGTRYSRSFGTKMDAEAWLSTERALIERDDWAPPAARKVAAERRQRRRRPTRSGRSRSATCRSAACDPNTVRGYESLLSSRILPYFGDMPLRDVTLAEIKAWRATLNPLTDSTNAAAYRLLRSLMQAAEEEELIDRAPPKIRGASKCAGEARRRAGHLR